MIGVHIVVGALAVLLAVLLFGFVGCGFSGSPAEISEDYPTSVKATEGLVAYWRFGEPHTTPVPSGGGAAKDEVQDENGNLHNGDYFKLDPAPTPDDPHHSPATAGDLFLGAPGLLKIPPQDQFTGMLTDGGYVRVPWDARLNPQQFTFEAWVQPVSGLDPKYFYCLAESTGPQGLVPKKTGWGLFLGPADINNPDPAGPLFWQVWMGDGTRLNRVAIAKPDFPSPGFSQFTLTYLALTFDGLENLQLFLYFPGTGQDLSIGSLQALDTPEPGIDNFVPNDASPDGQGAFFIGTGGNLTLIPASHRLYPFKGEIQEAALYKVDLSAPNNLGVQTTLASHVTSGGNL
jgi:hypothetical protein